jgi:uncharacterized protein (DUF1697 family)
MPQHIALLRGINIGSRRRIAMADLRSILTAAGYENVQTFLQSGNVLLGSSAAPDRVACDVEQLISANFAIDVPVIVRSRAELADVIARDAIADAAADPKRYQVSFLSAELDPAVAERLRTVDTSPERLVISGREIFTWHPEGIQQSGVAKLLSDRRLGVTLTARNWNTVTKLLELCDAASLAI